MTTYLALHFTCAFMAMGVLLRHLAADDDGTTIPLKAQLQECVLLFFCAVFGPLALGWVAVHVQSRPR